jgi:hypothetical protein
MVRNSEAVSWGGLKTVPVQIEHGASAVWRIFMRDKNNSH